MLKKIATTAADVLKGVSDAVASQSNTYSPQTEYRNAEKVAQMYSDAINTQYAAGIQNLTEQQKAIPLQYDPQRASANLQYERGVRNNQEQMANLGLTRSGTNLTAQTALETERASNIAAVNAAQDEATRNLQAQINEYMAQRDSAIAQQKASVYQNAYDNVSEYQRQLAQMEKQQQYDKEMAAISHTYNQEMAALQHEYDIALANNNHEKTAALQREMAALEQQYKIETLNKQAELDMQVYDKKAATDWNYYQKQANLDSSLSKSEYGSKAATDWNYYQKQAALDNQYDIALAQAKAAAEVENEAEENAVDLTADERKQILAFPALNGAFDINTKKWANEQGKQEWKLQLDEWVASGQLTKEDYFYFLDAFGY